MSTPTGSIATAYHPELRKLPLASGLFAALIRSAFHDLQYSKRHGVRADALDWLTETSPDIYRAPTLSFSFCCTMLGLPVEQVRQHGLLCLRADAGRHAYGLADFNARRAVSAKKIEK